MQGIAFGPTFSRYAITFTSFYSLPVQENDMPSRWEAFKIAPWKKSVSRRPFWHSGVKRYGRNNTVGQSRWRRDIHMLLGIYTGCMGLAAQFLKHTWHSHNFGYTAPVSTAPFPKLSTWRSPTQPSESGQCIPFHSGLPWPFCAEWPSTFSKCTCLWVPPDQELCPPHSWFISRILQKHEHRVGLQYNGLNEYCSSYALELSLHVYVLFLLPQSEQHTSSFA